MDLSQLEAIKDQLKEQEPEIEKEDLEVVPIKSEEAPEEVIEPIEAPDIRTRIYIDYPYLREFYSKDFNVDEPTMIDLVREDINQGYWFIVFMDESTQGRNRLQEWLELSQIVKNDYCKLGYCNLSFEKEIFGRFRDLGKVENLDHPFYWCRFIELPFFLVIRGFWPVGFYNGPLNQKAVVDFIMLKASNGLIEIEKSHTMRRDFNTKIFEENKKKMEESQLREKAKEEDKKKREELKKINPKTQEVTKGINFLEDI